ncbi:NmrA family protein [Colletotrichum plurivorum]|uniref:NmrA family protein n=1 Tax=Colletotrichum plurivorum TaxID=2175906 RepID=A0A8H6N5C0_9PEZI|nr:NmrA family protein [Colletotrichum plurivorum]
MPPHITVLPASTQAGTQTIRFLLSSSTKPLVRGIYRNPAKAPAEFTNNPNFEAIQGDVAAADSGLDFSGSDAVLYVAPPTWDNDVDHDEYSYRTANKVRDAVRENGVGRVVIQSAMGAHYDKEKIGTLRLNHITDEVLKDAAPEVVIVRPGYYFQFWAAALESMQQEARFESPFSPEDLKIPMVSTKDVGEYLAKTLLADSIAPDARDVRLFGPRHYSALDVKEAIETVTGKKGEVSVVPEKELAEYWGKSIPAAHVPDFVVFIKSLLPGGVIAQDYADGTDSVRMGTELVDELREIARRE